MRLIVARCSVRYAGRLEATLPEAVRLIMVKADGCVAIHSDGGAYKPLNWMNAPNTIEEREGEWIVSNPKGEVLHISLLEIHTDSKHEFGEDPGLLKDGVEAHLQELLAAVPDTIESGLTLVRREWPTAIGPVDLMCIDSSGHYVAVEVKRRGEIDGVEQLSRYLDVLKNDSQLTGLRGILVAQSIKPQAKVVAEQRGIGWAEVDYDDLRGRRPEELRLF
jgi:endonuclease